MSPPPARLVDPQTDREWVIELIRVMEWLVAHDEFHHKPHRGWQAELVSTYLGRVKSYLSGKSRPGAAKTE